MWRTLKQKQNVIDTIMGEKEIDEEAVMEIMFEEILNDYEES